MCRKLAIFILVLTILSSSTDSILAITNTFEPVDKNIQLRAGDTDSPGLSWPSEEIILQKAIGKNKISVSDIDYLNAWVRTVLKKEWVPDNLADYFILLENLHIQSDYFIGRYKKDNNIIQIKIGDGYLWLTIKPVKELSSYRNKEEFVLDVVKTFINYNKDQLAKFKVLTNQYQTGGELKIERPKAQETLHKLQYKYWYEDIVWQIMEGQYILFTISPPKEVKMGGKPRFEKTDWKAGMPISE